MKNILAIIIMIFSLGAKAEPFAGWTDNEKLLYGAASLALLADYKSTSSVLYPNQGYRELNPFLGEQPSKDKLTLWFIGWITAHYFIADSLNHEDRKQWLITITIVETAAASHNVSIGAKIRF